MLASDFVDESATVVLDRMKRDLESIQDSGHVLKTRWSIPLARPLRTKPSLGEYAPDSMGELSVFGELSFVWEVVRVARRRGASTHFTLDGLASILVALKKVPTDAHPEEETLTSWRIEVGDDAAPGTHFHVQLNKTLDAPSLPRTLDVPRLPAFAMTPLLALEALLAEIFQDRWKTEALLRTDASAQTWNRLHRTRIEAFLNWQREGLDARRRGSPWVVLKTLKPTPGDQLDLLR